jgi:hypothetical protein
MKIFSDQNIKNHKIRVAVKHQRNKKKKKGPTFDVGLVGWILVHLCRVFPLAEQL